MGSSPLPELSLVSSLVASVDTVGVDPSVTLYVGMGMLTGIDCAGPELEGGPAGTLVGAAALKYHLIHSFIIVQTLFN